MRIYSHTYVIMYMIQAELLHAFKMAAYNEYQVSKSDGC